MNDKTFLSSVAILGLVVLESIAMITGQDGAYFTLIVAAVAAVGGYSLAQQESLKALLCQQAGLPATTNSTKAIPSPMPTARRS